MTTHKQQSKTAYLALCGLFAAFTAICSYINIPLGFTPIPMNLATLAVFMAGGLLGKKYGAVSILVYVLMGAAGLPVFAGFQAGIGVLAGPTGGFLVGYIAASFIVGFITENRSNRLVISMAAMTAGLIVCYALGTLWFMFVTGSSFIPAIAACVIPFIPGDIIKICAGAFLISRLRSVL